ncbi:unnamed protein product [Alopecurus aequalis]
MASGAQVKMAAVGMMLAILFIAAAHASTDGTSTKSCFYQTDDTPGLGDCICSKNCACAGKCILKGGDKAEEIRTCFVDCVLKNDCYSNNGGTGAETPV